MPTVARELMPDLDVRRLARSVHETAARLGDGREEFEPFDRFLLERQAWWGRLFLDPDSQYEIPAEHRFGFLRRLVAVVFQVFASGEEARHPISVGITKTEGVYLA